MKIDAWYRLRMKRDQYLTETDKYMIADFPIVTQERVKYKDYRHYLRNLPKMFDEETIKTAKVKNFKEWLAWKQGGEY